MIELIKSHRSIRAFKESPLTDNQIDLITESGQWAPTSHHVQAYSILVIKNEEKKKQLAALAGNQVYVEKCPVFFVICADFYRLKQASEKHDQPFEVGEHEQVLVGSIDATLVAQNMLLAARAQGLGGVMIGGIRNDPEAISTLLELPQYTFPVMGLCVGYPDQHPDQKPRLPKRAVIHEERYNQEIIGEALEDYDKTISSYYSERTNGKRKDTWTEHMAHHFSTPKRKEVGSHMKKQGFLK